MRIGIIGAGFTGLSAGYNLLKKGNEVIIFEKESLPGGLALGFKEKNWQWPLETYYHHWFTNDNTALDLAKDINQKVVIKRPKTSVYLDDSLYQLDSPLHLLKFNKLSLFDRIRMGITLGILRYNPLWKPLENIRTSEFLPLMMGKKAYEMIWEPQLRNKFGSFSSDISLAWFWARIKKRTSNLAYPSGGFLSFANRLSEEIIKNGGKIYYDNEISELNPQSNGTVDLVFSQKNDSKKISYNFDAVIFTLSSFVFLKTIKNLPPDYKSKLKSLKGLGASNLVLRLKKQFLKDGTYWLSVCEKGSPIMAIVEHTNFIDKEYYNNEHIIYLGNYLSVEDQLYNLNKEDLLKLYDPFLKKINKEYQNEIIDYHLFKTPFAQPIITLNYSKKIPPFETPIKNVYLANMQQVYPWDRGTNYALELGEKVANLIENKK